MLSLATNSYKLVPVTNKYIIRKFKKRDEVSWHYWEKTSKELNMIPWSTSINGRNNQNKHSYSTFHITYNIAIWCPTHYIPFDCDISSRIKWIIGFCRNIKDKGVKTWILTEYPHSTFPARPEFNFLPMKRTKQFHKSKTRGSLQLSVFAIYEIAP